MNNNTDVEISVIVPVYNVERQLPRCIDSILRQSFRNFELILVDDCSLDGAGRICDHFAELDGRIRVVHKPQNNGVSAARNTGIDLACGKYIAFCDSDDYTSGNWLQKLHDAMEQSDAGIAICGFDLVQESGACPIVQHTYGDAKRVVISQDGMDKFWRSFLNNQNHIVLSSVNKLFRRGIIEQKGLRFPVGLAHSEDVLFVFRYYQLCEQRIVVINECLYHYVVDTAGSLTKRYKTNYWDVKLESLSELKKVFQKAGVIVDPCDPDYATYQITTISFALDNILHLSNPAGLFGKWRELRRILGSPECTLAFQHGRFVDIPPKYQMVLRTRSAGLVLAFLSLVQWKNAQKQSEK